MGKRIWNVWKPLKRNILIRLKKLDKFLGQDVEIKFFDNDLKFGTLYKSKEKMGSKIYYLQLHNNPYIGKLYFSKYHVKKIDKI